MHLRIAHRQNGETIIQCGAELEYYFELGAHFQAIYLEEDKSLYLTKDPKARVTCHEPTAYCREGITRSIILGVLPSWIPAFSINQAEFTVDGDLLAWHRPPVWMLDWPLKSAHDAARAREHVIHGLLTRLRSAKRNEIDPRKVTTKVPDWAKSSLNQGEWMQIVRSVFP